MKFPRQARIYRGHLDAAPFAGVFFCLLIFILLASLVYTPGVIIQLPDSATPLPGSDGPTLSVAVDANGVLYYQNQIIEETNLLMRLQAEVRKQSEPLTLIVQADRKVTIEQEDRLRDIAGKAGVRQLRYAVLPRVFDPPNQTGKP
jgi:biopolymer transport protein ExbD